MAGEIDPESAETGALFSLKLPLLWCCCYARGKPKAPSHCAHIVLDLFIKIFLSAAESPITSPCLEHSQSPNGKEAYSKQFKSQQ
jgi:hypothetical protein